MQTAIQSVIDQTLDAINDIKGECNDIEKACTMNEIIVAVMEEYGIDWTLVSLYYKLSSLLNEHFGVFFPSIGYLAFGSSDEENEAALIFAEKY